ncbi:MAG: hypothetical protein AAB667_02095 [Patescibacteria group bacterium]
MAKNKIKKPDIDIRASYLAMIKNSVGTKLFRNFYFKINGRSLDVLENGDLSCAVYVTSILYLLRLIKEPHTTVIGTIEDMEKSGWYKIKKPKLGAIILWGFKKLPGGKLGKHRHVGFYLNKKEAISNDSKSGQTAKHHINYGYFPNGETKRDIQAFYWHKRLN